MSEERAREILRKMGMTESEIDKALEGMKKSLEEYKKGNYKTWEEVKKELGIE